MKSKSKFLKENLEIWWFSYLEVTGRKARFFRSRPFRYCHFKKKICYFTIWKSFEVDSEISKSRDSGMAESVGTLSFPIKVVLSEKPSELMPELSWVTVDQHLQEQILLLNLWKVEERLLQFRYKGWGWNNSRWLEARHFTLRSLLPHWNVDTFFHFSIPISNPVKTLQKWVLRPWRMLWTCSMILFSQNALILGFNYAA